MEAIEKLVKIEDVISKNEDLIGDDALILRRSHSVLPPAELEAQLKKITEDNRQLNIGIIGRVKAGKSSLLNSLFFKGESTLPEAATPMTAALTVLSFGEQCKVKAHFFTKDDVEIIRREHGECLDAKDAVVKERKKASYEQYEKMKQSGKNIDRICEQAEKEIDAGDVCELAGKLADFVGADGEYMPFTKSVEIQFKKDELEDIRVVDTPGVNDPIKSREARTEEYLRECDVVFIVSTAGQFISDADLELMDRLSAREGVRELFLVASMADLGVILHSVVENSRGILPSAIDSLKQDLSGHAVSALENVKKRHPEIKDQFDQLIDGGEDRFFMVSGLCYSMFQRYEKKEDWSAGMKGVWNNLAKYYPDNFDKNSGRESLELLADVEPIKKQLARVRKKKDKIIAEKSADYRKQQDTNIEAFHTELKSMIRERVEKLNSSDLQSLRAEKERLEGIVSGGSEAIDAELREKIGGVQKRLKNALSDYIRRLTSDVDNSAEKETVQDSYTEVSRAKRDGALSGVARFFGSAFGNDWGWDVKTWEVTTTTLRAGAVKRSVQSGVDKFSSKLDDIVNEELSEIKNKLPGQIKKSIQDAVGEDAVDPMLLNRATAALVRDYAGDIVWDYTAPSFDYPSAGTITNEEINGFLSKLDAFIRSLSTSANSAVKELFRRVDENKAAKNPAQYVFADAIKQLDSLTRDLETKTTTLKRLTDMGQTLQEIV